MTLQPKIFDHTVLAKNRNRSINNFQNSNFIHRLVADLILEIIIDQGEDFNNILEIGGLDSYLSKEILQKLPKSNIFNSEISPLWAKSDNFCPKVIMNDEFIAFKENVFDLICSNLNAHFYNDLLGYFIQSHHCLKTNGFFIASFIANDSFFSLKKIFNEIEVENYQRFVPRFIPTTDIKTVGMLLQKAGFSDIVSVVEKVDINYDNPAKIFLDIKNSAGSNIMFDRGKKFMTKKFLNDIYKKLEDSKINNKINVNLNIVIIFGWKK
ncbi:MAG: NADH dehydrogenase [ubiquinone] 1 alpha subcomplex assembly factor 5 [Ulvibacter sp.]|jgi:NADH dehydrogenase [ubiquinone] 1 alpha subcomplex assembly factor 5